MRNEESFESEHATFSPARGKDSRNNLEKTPDMIVAFSKNKKRLRKATDDVMNVDEAMTH